MAMFAVILAGGFGKRLRPLTDDRPKPLVEVAGRPILAWQIDWLREQGVTDIILAVGYLGGKIFDYIGDGSQFGVRVYYSVEREPLGTGGAVRNALKYINDDGFIVVNGDVITNLRIGKLMDSLQRGVIGAIALTPLKSPYGIVQVDEDGFILNFQEKPQLPYLINAGVYALRTSIRDYLPEKGDIEVYTFPRLAKDKKLIGITYNDVYWKSIDTLKDLEEADKAINEQGVFNNKVKG
ncbi:Nucleotidyl transferase [Caldivirga maquilingensis IC-167]|uniref:Nucleotidyl transferase n=2 Tax=Caldivirga maquilingensis TaxID=76887 RepID=A8MDH4_CALMQ|nr:Nucleotidyl transferase [Caldivirga maquilingensis IC-167]